MPKDLRTFLEDVAARYPDEIKTVDEEVDARVRHSRLEAFRG